MHLMFFSLCQVFWEFAKRTVLHEWFMRIQNSQREPGHAILRRIKCARTRNSRKFRMEIATSMRTLTKKTFLKYIKARFRPFSISLTLLKEKKNSSEIAVHSTGFTTTEIETRERELSRLWKANSSNNHFITLRHKEYIFIELWCVNEFDSCLTRCIKMIDSGKKKLKKKRSALFVYKKEEGTLALKRPNE